MWFIVKAILFLLSLFCTSLEVSASLREDEPFSPKKDKVSTWISFAVGVPIGSEGDGEVEVFYERGFSPMQAQRKAVALCNVRASMCVLTTTFKVEGLCLFISFGLRYLVSEWVMDASPMIPQRECMKRLKVICTRAVPTC